jgi:LPS export ABC transporter protein LptC
MKQQRFVFNIIRIIKTSGIAALFLGAAILFYACENNIEEIKAFSSPENLPILEATNFQTLFTDSGQIRFLLKAPKLLQFENEGKDFIEFPNGMELVEYDANKNIISTLSADYAKQFVKEEKWVAKNNVVATNAQGDSLKTEHLIWEEKTEKIYTDEFVKIIRPNSVISGVGLVSDQALQDWKILKPTGTIYVEVNNENRNTQENEIQEQPFEIKNETEKPLRPIQFKK